MSYATTQSKYNSLKSWLESHGCSDLSMDERVRIVYGADSTETWVHDFDLIDYLEDHEIPYYMIGPGDEHHGVRVFGKDVAYRLQSWWWSDDYEEWRKLAGAAVNRPKPCADRQSQMHLDERAITLAPLFDWMSNTVPISDVDVDQAIADSDPSVTNAQWKTDERRTLYVSQWAPMSSAIADPDIEITIDLDNYDTDEEGYKAMIAAIKNEG